MYSVKCSLMKIYSMPFILCVCVVISVQLERYTMLHTDLTYCMGKRTKQKVNFVILNRVHLKFLKQKSYFNPFWIHLNRYHNFMNSLSIKLKFVKFNLLKTVSFGEKRTSSRLGIENRLISILIRYFFLQLKV